ncbi:hypothetical protein Tco_0018110 [Tanacetum coccineum]
MRMGDANMLKKSSEKHSTGKSHIGTFGHTYHSFGNVGCKIKVFSNGKTVDHVVEISIGMVLVSREAYGILTKDDFPFFKIGFQFGYDHLEGVEGNVYSFDLTSLTRRSKVEKGITNWNMKNAGKFLKIKCDFDISNDESDGEGSIQATNKTNTFVEFKNKYQEIFSLISRKKSKPIAMKVGQRLGCMKGQ